jgi:hypothetical protein
MANAVEYFVGSVAVQVTTPTWSRSGLDGTGTKAKSPAGRLSEPDARQPFSGKAIHWIISLSASLLQTLQGLPKQQPERPPGSYWNFSNLEVVEPIGIEPTTS